MKTKSKQGKNKKRRLKTWKKKHVTRTYTNKGSLNKQKIDKITLEIQKQKIKQKIKNSLVQLKVTQ